MKRSKLVCLSLSLLVSIGLLAGCGGEKKEAGKASETVLKIGHVEPEDRSTHKALLNFKKKVEERSKGSLKIEIYPNGALGGDVQLSEAVATGSLDMALPSTSVLTTYNDEFGVLDMPYLFKSSEAAFKALDGDVGKELNGKIASKGIDILGYSYNGPRSTTSKVKPIVTPEDLKGLKMRVMESPIFIDFYKTLGANPTPMSFTELYTGLQQGTVEAQENPPSLTFANKFYEVQKYSTIDEHVHNFLAFLINDAKFKSLSADNQKILQEEAKAYVDEQRKMELADNEKAIKDLETIGKLQTNILTADQKSAMRKALHLPSVLHGVVGGAVMWAIIERLHLEKFVDLKTIKLLSGFFLELVVFTAMATLNLKFVSTYAAPLAIYSIVLTTLTVPLVLFCARKFAREEWFEKACMCFGAATGNTSTGLALVRSIDPNSESHAGDSHGIYSTISAWKDIFVGLTPLWLMSGLGFTAGVGAVVMVAFLAIGFIFFNTHRKLTR